MGNKHIYTVFIMITAFVLILSGIVFLKYVNFQYNGADLAIFNNVFFNSISGDWVFSSIQNSLYFADHFTPIIFVLLPDYWFFQSPMQLLIYQILFMALATWPLFLIAREKLNFKLSLLVVLSYLLNPLVWNMALFEFHLLPLAFFTLFFTYYFYLRKNFRWFVVFLILSLMVREDVALFTLMLGVLFWLKDKLRADGKFVWTTIGLSAVWFVGAMQIIRFFAGENYKFWVYYSFSWDKIFNLAQIELVLVLLLPFFFLPLMKIKYLIPISLIFLQYFLLGGAGSIVAQGHYATLLLVGLLMALIYALEAYQNNESRLLIKAGAFVPVILIVATVYSNLAFGPVLYLKQIKRPVLEKQVMQEYLDLIPDDAKIVASYEFLPYLSSRKYLYSLNYVFLGKKQFSDQDYELPEDLDYVVFDDQDLLKVQLQYQDHFYYAKFAENGFQRIEELFQGFTLVHNKDHFWLLAKEGSGFESKVTENNYRIELSEPKKGFYSVRFDDRENNELEKRYYFFSEQLNFRNVRLPEQTKQIKIQPIKLTGFITLNRIGRMVPVVIDEQPSSEVMVIEL